jgi:elongation factor 1-alpha
MSEAKQVILGTAGHIDHGKSTTVGRLLYDSGVVPKHVIEGYKKEAEAKGKGTFEFAWVMDNLKEERERGITLTLPISVLILQSSILRLSIAQVIAISSKI